MIDIGPGLFMDLVLDDVADERVRQDEKWGQQNHPDGTGFENSDGELELAREDYTDAKAAGELTWVEILREEVAEAFVETDPVRLRHELVQVAAVAVAWIEAIDRRQSNGDASE